MQVLVVAGNNRRICRSHFDQLISLSLKNAKRNEGFVLRPSSLVDLCSNLDQILKIIKVFDSLELSEYSSVMLQLSESQLGQVQKL